MTDLADRRPSSRWRQLFDSLLARTVLVVLLSIGTVHLVSLWIYQHNLAQTLELSNEARLADRLIAIKRAILRAPEDEREAVAHDMSGGPIEAHWSRTEYAIRGGPGAAEWEGLGHRLRQLAPEIAEDGLVIGANRRVVDDPHLALISMRLPDQSWVNVTLVAWTARVEAGHGTLVSTSLMAFGAVLVSIFLVRWLTQPLTAFARAAKDLYRLRTTAPVSESGPAEVRALAVAFNDMQRRIARLIEDRTQALAAVSHDLKTPITRLRFRLEDVADDEVRTSINADLDDMERMIDQTLAYLRGDRADEDLRAVNVVAILETIASDASDAGRSVTLSGDTSAVITGRRLALKRAFTNLIDNAIKYGERARVTVHDEPERILVAIADDGPGIAPADLERAMAPFVRLEPSRNPQTGGFGLGLTIAATIIEGHRGQIRFAKDDAGAFVVEVILPKDALGA